MDNNELIKGLAAIFFTVGVPLLVLFGIHRFMKKEKSVFFQYDSDVAVFESRPYTFEKFISSTMKNDGMLNLEIMNDPLEVEKFNEIPLYFEQLHYLLDKGCK